MARSQIAARIEIWEREKQRETREVTIENCMGSAVAQWLAQLPHSARDWV